MAHVKWTTFSLATPFNIHVNTLSENSTDYRLTSYPTEHFAFIGFQRRSWRRILCLLNKILSLPDHATINACATTAVDNMSWIVCLYLQLFLSDQYWIVRTVSNANFIPASRTNGYHNVLCSSDTITVRHGYYNAPCSSNPDAVRNGVDDSNLKATW
jgi:hypothetical protein